MVVFNIVSIKKWLNKKTRSLVYEDRSVNDDASVYQFGSHLLGVAVKFLY